MGEGIGKSWLTTTALPGLVTGALFGLCEAGVLHLFSSATYRDPYLFLVAVATYGLVGVAVLAVVQILLSVARRKAVAMQACHGYAILLAGFTALEFGALDGARGWLFQQSRSLLPHNPWKGWLAAVGVLVAIVFALDVVALRTIRLRMLLTDKFQALILAGLVVVAAGAALAGRSTGPPPDDRPNILLIVMDTERADGLSCYTNRREPKTTPNIDAIAQEGIVFERAFAQAPWTFPSHASLFTGLHGTQHGASHLYPHLADRYVTLAEFLSDQGYNTIAFSNNAAYVKPSTGLGQGFDRFYVIGQVDKRVRSTLQPYYPQNYPVLRLFDWWSGDGETEAFEQLLASIADEPAATAHRVPWKLARETVRMAGRWLSRYRSGKPFFMFINFIEPHDQYDPPQPYLKEYLTGLAAEPVPLDTPQARLIWKDLTEQEPLGDKKEELKKRVDRAHSDYYEKKFDVSPQFPAALRARYDAETRYLDHEMGRLFTLMRRSNLLDSTAVLITSDHGESFGEHRLWRHRRFLYNNDIWVPLILRYPKQVPEGKRVTRAVQLIDIFPTVEQLIGSRLEVDADQRFGISLLSDVPADRPVFSQEGYTTAPTTVAVLEANALRIERMKVDAPEALQKVSEYLESGQIAEPLRELDRRHVHLPAGEAGRAERKKLARDYEALQHLIPYNWSTRAAILKGRWKYIWNSYAKDGLYDLSVDFDETNNLIDRNKELAERLHKELAAYMARFKPADVTLPIGQTDEEDANDKATMGYSR